MRSSWLRLQFQSGASWKTARRVEARRVQKLRKEKETTNPYHRAQYISAYVESRSADFAHRSMVQQRAPAVSLPAHPTLLQLADSLEKQYGTGASLAKSPQAPHESRVARSPSSSADVVAFGAWRSSATNTDASSSAVLPHCILRDAKTPPGLSTEVLRRRVAWHSPPVKAFCIMLNQKEDVDASNVLGAARRLYVKLEVPRRSANVEDRLRHGCNLASCMLDEMVPRMGWEPCVEFLRWYVQRISREHRATPSTTTTTASSSLFTPMSAVSQVVAVMAESMRYHHPQLSSSSYPSLEDLELLCVELCSIIASGLTQSQPTTLLPVVAAPLLSIIHLSRDTNTAPSVDAVLRFGATHLEQRGKRRYLPSLAWGELIRAADRCGASHTDLQHLVDRITDPAQTKHAERLLRDPHVWSAYLACSPAKHAISIYAENRAHYKVAESSELVAAMMMAHLRSGEGEEAVKVWRKHQRPQPGGRPAPSITTSIAVALVRAHALTHNRNALLRMCADYPGLWHTFAGATVAETWASLNGPALLQKAEVAAREAKTVQSGAYLDHLRAMCRATREWEFPPVIVAALHEAIAALDAPGATTPTSVPELTTDAVADLMM